MVFHGWHPNSPLLHPLLTKRVFFSNGISESYLLEFQRRICPYESFLWPLGMMRRFTDAEVIAQQISGWGSGQRILVMSGTEDKLMTVPVMQKLAAFFRDAVTRLAQGRKNDAVVVEQSESLEGEGGLDTVDRGVRYCLVPGAGHHLQNDVMWEVGARKLAAFYDQL